MRVDSNGVGIEYELVGPADGPPVVLLHGFPDSGRVWRNQVPVLAAAGLRVIVPDMRGCGASDRPDAIEAYQVHLLAGDVVAVLDDLDIEQAAVVGHDWGAAIAWALASAASSRVERLAALSLGHPTAFRGADLAQQEKSWYLLLFFIPGVAERWLSDNRWANMRQWSGHPDAEAVIADLEQHQSLTSALNWYRANVAPATWVDPPPRLPAVRCPVMGVWSSGDFALLEAQMTASAQYCAGGFRYHRVDNAGHWLQLDAPETINRLLVDFLT